MNLFSHCGNVVHRVERQLDTLGLNPHAAPCWLFDSCVSLNLRLISLTCQMRIRIIPKSGGCYEEPAKY